MAEQNPNVVIKKRAELYKQLRSFFYERGLIEIEAPLLSPYATTDLQIESISAHVENIGRSSEYYLITSPEFYMKRLLCAGSSSIFYLGKVFRQGESSARHHYEFTLLEWYRLSWDEHKLMEEVAKLLQLFFPEYKTKKITYGQLFKTLLQLDPHQATLVELQQCIDNRVELHSRLTSKNDCLDLLFSHCIEPTLTGITLVHDYPSTQAALARVEKNTEGSNVARRFEVFVDDMELGNGYFELTDGSEQRERFLSDLEERKKAGKKSYPCDESLLRAMEKNLPSCAGVALGVDRLLLKILDLKALSELRPLL